MGSELNSFFYASEAISKSVKSANEEEEEEGRGKRREESFLRAQKGRMILPQFSTQHVHSRQRNLYITQ